MISRIDHISIAVRDYPQAERFFCDVLGAVPCAHAVAEDKKFFWHIFMLGDLSRLEIITPTGEGSFLDGFLAKRPGGFHHISLQTSDIDAMARLLDEKNIPYFGRRDYPGGYWRELFIHPKDAFGALIQIAEFNADDWLADELKLPDNQRWAVTKTEEGYQLAVSHPGGGTATLALSRDELQQLGADIQAELNK